MTGKACQHGVNESDLRTRIAKELFNRFGKHLGYADAPWDGVEQQSWLEDADAVIAELGLMRDPFSTVAFCRYVTQWQPNERFR